MSTRIPLMSLIGVVIPFILLVAFALYTRRRRPSHPYPPGPKGKPLVGNVSDMPKQHPWLAFFKFGKEYGPLVYLNVMGQPVLVINDHKTAVDLLEKRWSIYSDRYHSVMAMELAG